MKAWIFAAFCAASFSILPGLALAKDKPALSGLALQQIQARDFETTIEILFPAVVTVLQDAGYRINEADKTSGFVSGLGSTEQKMTFNWFWGFGKKKTVPVVSAFVEQRGPSIARVRLNFVLSKGKSRENMSDETPITDPAIYKDAFERIEKEVFIRQAMNAAPAAQNTAIPTTIISPLKNPTPEANGPSVPSVSNSSSAFIPLADKKAGPITCITCN